jgi:hypothetical protein
VAFVYDVRDSVSDLIVTTMPWSPQELVNEKRS